jgi:hypothetical protein
MSARLTSKILNSLFFFIEAIKSEPTKGVFNTAQVFKWPSDTCRTFMFENGITGGFK